MKPRRKPKTHFLKVWPQFFRPVQAGDVAFHICKHDAGYRIGDTLTLHEWCPKKRRFTGHECRAAITYLTKWQQMKGNCVIGVRVIQPEHD